MAGIPGNLLLSMKKMLKSCPEFESNTLLRAVFADELIAPWGDYIRETDNIDARADLVIDRLREAKRAETQMNVLWLLLRVLRDRTDPQNARYKELDDLARDFNNFLQSKTTSPNMLSSIEEANPDNQPMISTEECKKLLVSVRAVGRVSVPHVIDGRETGHASSGTGWLIAPDLVLTCLHVIEARTLMQKKINDRDREAQVKRSFLTFDYTLRERGVGYRVKTLECYDPILDYALVRLEDSRHHPLRNWGFLRLDVDASFPPLTSVYIIQHPKGEPQQTSLGRYIRDMPSEQDRPTYILHSAPTERGTSGAPLLNTVSWSVAALHTSEDDINRLRKATLLSAILSHIEQAKPALHSIILEATKER